MYGAYINKVLQTYAGESNLLCLLAVLLMTCSTFPSLRQGTKEDIGLIALLVCAHVCKQVQNRSNCMCTLACILVLGAV